MARTSDLSDASAAVQGRASRRSRRLARRALLAGGGLGLCAAGVAVSPVLLDKVGQYTSMEVQQAFQAGVDAGRQAVLDELSQLEGITIEGAIGVAEVTRLAVKYLVLPLARLTTTIGGDALGALASTVGGAQQNLARVHISIPLLDGLHTMLQTWHAQVKALPIALDDYTRTDIDSAETYLKALQRKLQSQVQRTATPGK